MATVKLPRTSWKIILNAKITTQERLAQSPSTPSEQFVNVDRNPDQDDAEDYVDHFRNGKGHASEVDRGGIVIHKGDDGHNGDDEVNRAFFVIAPRGFGCIIEVAAQHDADEQDRVDHILGAKRQEQYASIQETDDDHKADAAQFSAGEAAVYGKFSAVIARQKRKMDALTPERSAER